jgi:hypothetical protein
LVGRVINNKIVVWNLISFSGSVLWVWHSADIKVKAFTSFKTRITPHLWFISLVYHSATWSLLHQCLGSVEFSFIQLLSTSFWWLLNLFLYLTIFLHFKVLSCKIQTLNGTSVIVDTFLSIWLWLFYQRCQFKNVLKLWKIKTLVSSVEIVTFSTKKWENGLISYIKNRALIHVNNTCIFKRFCKYER